MRDSAAADHFRMISRCSSSQSARLPELSACRFSLTDYGTDKGSLNSPACLTFFVGFGMRPAVTSSAAAVQTQKAPEEPSPTHEGNLNLTVTFTDSRSLEEQTIMPNVLDSTGSILTFSSVRCPAANTRMPRWPSAERHIAHHKSHSAFGRMARQCPKEAADRHMAQLLAQRSGRSIPK